MPPSLGLTLDLTANILCVHFFLAACAFLFAWMFSLTLALSSQPPWLHPFSLLYMLQELLISMPCFLLLLELSPFLLTSFSPVSCLTLILFPTSDSFTLWASVFGPPAVYCLICDFLEWPRVCCGYPSRKPGIWIERTSPMINKKTDISQETDHSLWCTFFFFPSPHSIWLLRLEDRIVRIQHRLELVSERHQSLRDHLLCLTLFLSAACLSPGISAPLCGLLLYCFNETSQPNNPISYMKRSFYSSTPDSQGRDSVVSLSHLHPSPPPNLLYQRPLARYILVALG